MKNFWKRTSQKLSGEMILLTLAFLLFLFLTMIAASGLRGFYEYLDWPEIIYMGIFTVLSLIFTGMGKELCNGVRIAFSRRMEGVSRMELQNAIAAAKFAKGIVFLAAGITSAIYFVDLLYRMDSLITLGPVMSLIGLSLLYATIFALFVTLISGKLERLLVAYMEEPDGEIVPVEGQTVYFRLRGLGLTDREAEVARLVSCEMTNKEIGQMLYISDTTVKKHVTHILEKTGMEDRERLAEMIKGL